MPGPAFITGGSGFVGGAVLRRLTAKGRDVRALARSDEAQERVLAGGAAPVRGDLEDPQALLAGMRGCDTVFHVAGINATCLRDPAVMFRTNVEGTAHVVRAAAAAGVSRLIYTSSAATIGEAAGTVGREDSPHRGSFLTAYERSKYEAERRALSLGAALGLPVVCVNPSSVQGPGRTEGTARLLLTLVNARRPVVVDTWVSVVDVDDCAQGHLLAETSATPGQRYVLNGISLSARDAIDLLRSVCGRPVHTIRLPAWAVRSAGWAGDAAAHVTRREASLCREVTRAVLHGHRYDGSRAQRELGLRYRSAEDTVRRSLRWYREHGLIDRDTLAPDAA